MPVHLRPAALSGQFVDDHLRLWVLDDRRQPGSNRPEQTRCDGCGRAFGDIVFMRVATDGQALCSACVVLEIG